MKLSKGIGAYRANVLIGDVFSVSLHLTGQASHLLERKTAKEIYSRNLKSGNDLGTPMFYALAGVDRLCFYPIPDQDYEISVHYVAPMQVL